MSMPFAPVQVAPSSTPHTEAERNCLCTPTHMHTEHHHQLLPERSQFFSADVLDFNSQSAQTAVRDCKTHSPKTGGSRGSATPDFWDAIMFVHSDFSEGERDSRVGGG